MSNSRLIYTPMLTSEQFDECFNFVRKEISNTALRNSIKHIKLRGGNQELSVDNPMYAVLVYPIVVRWLCKELNKDLQNVQNSVILESNSYDNATQEVSA